MYAADPASGVKEPTIEFIAVDGGHRFVRVKDIVDVR
jgi:hypothetical protein